MKVSPSWCIDAFLIKYAWLTEFRTASSITLEICIYINLFIGKMKKMVWKMIMSSPCCIVTFFIDYTCDDLFESILLSAGKFAHILVWRTRRKRFGNIKCNFLPLLTDSFHWLLLPNTLLIRTQGKVDPQILLTSKWFFSQNC